MAKEQINSDQFNQLHQFLQEYTSISKEFLDKVDYGSLCDIQKPLFNFWQRFYFNISSIDLLFPAYRNCPQYKYSIGLLFRASILEYMSLNYLCQYVKIDFDKGKVIDNGFAEKLNDFNRKFFQKMENYIKDQPDDWKQDVLSSYFNSGEKHFIKIKPNEKFEFDNLKGKQINTKGLYDEMINQFSEMKEVYDYYTIFSQYEHTSFITKRMMQNQHGEEFKRFFRTFFYVLNGTILIEQALTIKKKESPLSQLNSNVENYLVKF